AAADPGRSGCRVERGGPVGPEPERARPTARGGDHATGGLANLLLSQQRVDQPALERRRQCGGQRGRAWASQRRPQRAGRRAPGAQHSVRPGPERHDHARLGATDVGREQVLKTRGTPAQRGAALLMAMLTVTLVATFAAAAAWQQWRATEVESAQRTRVQAGWVLVGALDWARLILRQDAMTGGADYLSEPWAVPLEEARLSTFLAAGQGPAGGAPGNSDDDDAMNAFLSGRIIDLQSRLNVLDLVANGAISQPALLAFGRLFSALGLPQSQLSLLAQNLQLALTNRTPSATTATSATSTGSIGTNTASSAGSDNPAAPLLPQRVGQLVWLGLSPATLTALRPYITLL